MRQSLNHWIKAITDQVFWLDITLRSYAQYGMHSSPLSGTIIMAMIGLADWWLLLATMISCLTANFVALHLKAPASLVKEGLLGWNPVLLAGILEVGRKPRWHALPTLVITSTLCTIIAVSLQRSLPAKLCMLQGSLACTLTQMVWECVSWSWTQALPAGESIPSLPVAEADTPLPVGYQGLFHATAIGVCSLFFAGVTYPYLWLVTAGLALGEPSACAMLWAGSLAGAIVDMICDAPMSHRMSGVSGLCGTFSFFITYAVSRPGIVGSSTAAAILLSACSALAAAFLSLPVFALRGCFPFVLVATIANIMDLIAAYREHMTRTSKPKSQ